MNFSKKQIKIICIVLACAMIIPIALSSAYMLLS